MAAKQQKSRKVPAARGRHRRRRLAVPQEGRKRKLPASGRPAEAAEPPQASADTPSMSSPAAGTTVSTGDLVTVSGRNKPEHPVPDSDADWERVLANDPQALAIAKANNPEPPPAFRPSVSQLRYLVALRESAFESRTPTDTGLAAALGISRTRIWEWRHDPAFNAWLLAEFRRDRDLDFELMLDRHFALAQRGSTKSAAIILQARAIEARLQGWVGASGGGEAVDASTHYTVNLLVPRPPALAPPDDGGDR